MNINSYEMEECPKCLGQGVAMEARDGKGFEYRPCNLCGSSGKVENEIKEDFLLYLNEDNLDIADNYYE